MKRTTYLVLFILLITLLTSCSKKSSSIAKETEDITFPTFELDENPQNVDYSMEMGFNLDNDAFFTYAGETLEIPYYIYNDGNSFSMGTYLFINGLIQEYISPDKENTYMYVTEVPTNTRVEKTLSVDKMTNTDNDEGYVRLCCVLNPETIPNQDNFDYKHDTSVTEIRGRRLEYTTKSGLLDSQSIPERGNYSIATDEEINEYYNAGINQINTRKVMLNIESLEGASPAVTDNGILNMHFRGLGGMEECTFNVYIFINSIPLIVEDEYPFSIVLKGERNMIATDISVDLSKLDADKYRLCTYNTVYMYAVPVSDNISDSIMKTETRSVKWTNYEK